MERSENGTMVPVGAGIVTALVGYTSAFAVVLAGLRAMGASPGQAASGLLAVTVTMGAASALLSWRYRMPIISAWSTPGAALLATTGAVAGGWPAAVGAFVVCGVLFVLTGLWPALARWVQRIPTPIAQAMLAGVLLPLCIAPVTSLAKHPWAVAPVLVVWLVLLKLRPRWAVPLAFVAALVVIAVALVRDDAVPAVAELVPHVEWTTPSITLQALTGVVLPLYIVTMASQNIPGAAVLASYGYSVPWRPSLAVTGVGSVLGAPFGGHAINLAAISAALAAGPDAGEDRSRRWIAGVSSGAANLVLGVLSTGLTAVVLAAPEGVIQAVAGVALVGAFAAACAGAMADESARVPAAVTFIVAASGTTVAGVGSAFWALVVGILVYVILGVRRSLDA
ncbi:benzoate/H(+) symporter BenE family transporter [Tsukamurella tyrosinosolvens]|uniref:benzoate/H(+) symporter BenE family transporter n=1 Tax=Tsukamurella tyrosinosolvens TaxID=57704 RepID=UPI0007997B3C|nr:benzoate/H(+) symporter BenE family transporter [Tsukamurella tyrosinosolvens]KXP05433.1 benzoate transporter [Tsukamurella tyrosinosolvens]KZL94817.1 benzoate transporter [Tsukamurella tyrosinosolvens]MEC4612892.1 benzoate/H(+) symporter BenE family transporter [Tsukamurella tyrosinosolvens]WEL94571.1 benzoate/H(+) symporter BenE family transporter [Tsukamurella tyrosinosolvens]